MIIPANYMFVYKTVYLRLVRLINRCRESFLVHQSVKYVENSSIITAPGPAPLASPAFIASRLPFIIEETTNDKGRMEEGKRRRA